MHQLVAVFVAAATLVLAATLDMPWWAIAGVAAWCGGVLILDVRHGRAQDGALLVIGIDRTLKRVDANGAVQSGNLLDRTYVTAFLTTIVWRPAGARCARCIAVWPDAMTAEDRRRLRVWLRFSTKVKGSEEITPS